MSSHCWHTVTTDGLSSVTHSTSSLQTADLISTQILVLTTLCPSPLRSNFRLSMSEQFQTLHSVRLTVAPQVQFHWNNHTPKSIWEPRSHRPPTEEPPSSYRFSPDNPPNQISFLCFFFPTLQSLLWTFLISFLNAQTPHYQLQDSNYLIYQSVIQCCLVIILKFHWFPKQNGVLGSRILIQPYLKIFNSKQKIIAKDNSSLNFIEQLFLSSVYTIRFDSPTYFLQTMDRGEFRTSVGECMTLSTAGPLTIPQKGLVEIPKTNGLSQIL